MAIEQSTIDFNFKAVDCDSEMRNAPTPQIISNELDFEDIDPMADFIANFQPTPSFGQELILDGANNYSNQMLASQTYGDSLPSTSSFNFTFNNSSYSNVPVNSNYIEDNTLSLPSSNIKMNSYEKNKNLRKDKCMTRNAIAARENREKKKREHDSLLTKLEISQEEASNYKKKFMELSEIHKKTVERNHYLESIILNLPPIVALIDHVNALPNKKLSNVNFHSDKLEDDICRKVKQKTAKSNHSGDNHLNNNPGICFHVKASHEMSLQFCQTCSSKNKKSNEKKGFS